MDDGTRECDEDVENASSANDGNLGRSGVGDELCDEEVDELGEGDEEREDTGDEEGDEESEDTGDEERDGDLLDGDDEEKVDEDEETEDDDNDLGEDDANSLKVFPTIFTRFLPEHLASASALSRARFMRDSRETGFVRDELVDDAESVLKLGQGGGEAWEFGDVPEFGGAVEKFGGRVVMPITRGRSERRVSERVLT